ncbi:MAG: RagB/SusD family nutrient uptake outer membrane protein [Raineya sp.]
MKLKYIKTFLLAGAIVFSTGACKKVLEPELEYAIEASRLQTILDFERVLNGAYATMRGVGYYSFGYTGGGDVGTDNMIETTASLGNNRPLAQWYYTVGSTVVSRVWNTPYQTINQANAVLDNIENLKETVPGQKNRIKGQALALRALAHFDLMRFFAASYDRNSSALGVAIKLKSEATYPPRNTVKECYDQIYKDLTEAEELLAEVDVPINGGSRKIKIDINGVRAIRARVSLYAKDWADAQKYADLVINSSGINLAGITAGVGITSSAITNTTTFQSVWFNDLNTAAEVIFAVAFNIGQGSPGFFPSDGMDAFTVSNDWLSLFGTNPTNDVRYNVTYNPAASPSTRSYLKFSGRFTGTAIPRDGNVDVKVFRMAEMYLIRAEANFNLGNEADARADIRTLRQNRIQGYVPGTDGVGDILEAIQVERRKELVGEGHRWFDAKRYGLGFDRGAAPGDGDCPNTAPDCSINAGDYRFVFPIPQSEILANVAMKNQQNQGW